MTDRVSQTRIFVNFAARFSDLIYLIARDRGLVTRNVEHSRFVAFDQNEFGHVADRNWNAEEVRHGNGSSSRTSQPTFGMSAGSMDSCILLRLLRFMCLSGIASCPSILVPIGRKRAAS